MPSTAYHAREISIDLYLLSACHLHVATMESTQKTNKILTLAFDFFNFVGHTFCFLFFKKKKSNASLVVTFDFPQFKRETDIST